MKWKLTQPGKLEVHGTCDQLVDALLDASQHCDVGYWHKRHKRAFGHCQHTGEAYVFYSYTGYLAEADKTTPAARIAELSIREVIRR